jgi:subtilisin family serine protease
MNNALRAKVAPAKRRGRALPDTQAVLLDQGSRPRQRSHTPKLAHAPWATALLHLLPRIRSGTMPSGVPRRALAVTNAVSRLPMLEAGRAREPTDLTVRPAPSRREPVDLVRLPPLMERSRGSPEVMIGLIDGPVAMAHPNLAEARIREVPGQLAGTCARASSAACQHGSFVAGILVAPRGSGAPGICPDCTLLLRPIFGEATTSSSDATMPSATPEAVAVAIVECLNAGARILNLSIALAHPSPSGQRDLESALDQSAQRGVIVVAAAGNQGTLGSSVITRHPWVIPVAACDRNGRPLRASNLGRSIGRRGLSAPGEGVTSLRAGGGLMTFGGTSAATPFVTGTLALLWSAVPEAAPAEITRAVTRAAAPWRHTVVPPLLDAWAAYQSLLAGHERR